MTEQPHGSSPRHSTDLNQRPLVGAPALNDGDVVLVNDLGYPIGAAQAEQCHRHDTPLHLGYACFVFDPEDKVLVVRRAPDVTWYPLTWTTSIVGHPNSAQPVTEAIALRLSHEYGLELHALRLIIPSFRYKATHAGIAENELCPVFAARVSGTFHFNSPHNDHYAWIPWRIFRDDVLRGRRHVSPWCTLQIAGVARMGDDPARWPACLPSELPPAMMYSGAWDSPDFGRERAIAHGGVKHAPHGADAPVERIALTTGYAEQPVALPGAENNPAAPAVADAEPATPPGAVAEPATLPSAESNSAGPAVADAEPATPGATPYETPAAHRRAVALTGPNAVVPLVASQAHPVETPTGPGTDAPAASGTETRASRRRHRDDSEIAAEAPSPEPAVQHLPQPVEQRAQRVEQQVAQAGEQQEQQVEQRVQPAEQRVQPVEQRVQPAEQWVAQADEQRVQPVEQAEASDPIPPGIALATARAVASYQPPASRTPRVTEPPRPMDRARAADSPRAGDGTNSEAWNTPLGTELPSGIAVSDAFGHRASSSGRAERGHSEPGPRDGTPAHGWAPRNDAARGTDPRRENVGDDSPRESSPTSERPWLPGVEDLRASLRELQRRHDEGSAPGPLTRADLRRQRQGEDTLGTDTASTAPAPAAPPSVSEAAASTPSPAAPAPDTSAPTPVAAPDASVPAPAPSRAASAPAPATSATASVPAPPLSRRERREANGHPEPVNDYAASLQEAAREPRGGSFSEPRKTSLPAGLGSTDDALAMTGGIPVIPSAHPEWYGDNAASSAGHTAGHAANSATQRPDVAPTFTQPSAPTPAPSSAPWGASERVWEAPMRARVTAASPEAGRHERPDSAQADVAPFHPEPEEAPAPVMSRRSVKEARQQNAEGAPEVPPVSIWDQMVQQGAAPADIVSATGSPKGPVDTSSAPPSAPFAGPPGAIPTNPSGAMPAHSSGTTPAPPPGAPSAGQPSTLSAAHPGPPRHATPWADVTPPDQVTVGDGWGSTPNTPSTSRTGATAADVAWLEQWERDHLQGPGRSAAPTGRDPYTA